MQEASYYKKLGEGKVVCRLCPRFCVIRPGEAGNCLVRSNQQGTLYTDVYGAVSAENIDPVEKKPLYHFYPGKKILSIGTVGCNFHCSFCQNYRISQCRPADYFWLKPKPPDEIVAQARLLQENIGVAYTYNEPVVFFEFMLDTARQVTAAGMKNVVVSNGFINSEPLAELLPYIDAFNIDLKGFDPGFYRERADGELQPVLNTLRTITHSKSHLEITFLVIPGVNDQLDIFQRMISWIADELGAHVPLHLSRYFPAYKSEIGATSTEMLQVLSRLARKKLHHVYWGNAHAEGMSDTYCPHCRYAIVRREQYSVRITGLDEQQCCLNCGASLSEVLIR